MFIVRRRGGLTAKALGRKLRCRASYKFLPRRREFIVNYGGKCTYANLNANVDGNKLKAHHKMVDSGITMPKVFHKEEEVPQEAFPLLARKKYHSQGKDVIFVANRHQLENQIEDYRYDYLIEYINKKSEYRVHVLGDYKTFVSVKFNKDGCGDPIVRSHNNGWRQIEYNGKWKDKLIELAKQAVKNLGYDFGAVDIIRRKDKLYVLEVNSSPGLEERKSNIYADYFKVEERKARYGF